MGRQYCFEGQTGIPVLVSICAHKPLRASQSNIMAFAKSRQCCRLRACCRHCVFELIRRCHPSAFMNATGGHQPYPRLNIRIHPLGSTCHGITVAPGIPAVIWETRRSCQASPTGQLRLCGLSRCHITSAPLEREVFSLASTALQLHVSCTTSVFVTDPACSERALFRSNARRSPKQR